MRQRAGTAASAGGPSSPRMERFFRVRASGRVNQRSHAFALTLGLGPPKGASIDRLSGAGASAGALSSTLGVAQCGRSAGCVLCALWAVPAAVLGGGVPCGSKHISISSSSCSTDYNPYGRDGLAHSRSLSSPRGALCVLPKSNRFFYGPVYRKRTSFTLAYEVS